MSLFSERFAELKATRPWDAPIWRLNSKLAARQFAAGLGVRVPELLRGPTDSPELAEWTPLPAPAFVVKPNDGCSAVGVLPLVQVRSGYRSLLGDGTHSWEGWQRWIRSVERRRPRTFPHPDNWRGPWIAEELVGARGSRSPRLPDDWKCYIIGGRVQFVGQFRRDPRRPRRIRALRTCYRRRDMEPIPGGVNRNRPAKGDLPAPRHGGMLVATAERIAAELEETFVRIDLYEDQEGIVFGEITPEPGALVLHDEWDRRMGEVWREAEAAG